MGISIFMRGHTCLYILLHFAGTVLTALFYSKVRHACTLSAFSCHPAAIPATCSRRMQCLYL